MKKSFTFVGLIINSLVIAAFVYVGRGMLEPHHWEQGFTMAMPAILLVTVGWAITAVLWSKSSSLAVCQTSIAITYAVALLAMGLNAGIVMGDRWFMLSMSIWALLILGIAYAAMYIVMLCVGRCSHSQE